MIAMVVIEMPRRVVRHAVVVAVRVPAAPRRPMRVLRVIDLVVMNRRRVVNRPMVAVPVSDVARTVANAHGNTATAGGFCLCRCESNERERGQRGNRRQSQLSNHTTD